MAVAMGRPVGVLLSQRFPGLTKATMGGSYAFGLIALLFLSPKSFLFRPMTLKTVAYAGAVRTRAPGRRRYDMDQGARWGDGLAMKVSVRSPPKEPCL